MTTIYHEERRITLLKAAYDLLQTCMQYRHNPVEVLVEYDGTECDVQCLMEDIQLELEHAKLETLTHKS